MSDTLTHTVSFIIVYMLYTYLLSLMRYCFANRKSIGLNVIVYSAPRFIFDYKLLTYLLINIIMLRHKANTL